MDIFQGYALLEALQNLPVGAHPAISLLVGRETEDLFSLPNRFIFENANLHDGIFLKTLSKIIIKRLFNAFLLF